MTYTQTKTTDESDDAVVIPMNSATLALLRSRPKGGTYVFPQGDSFLKAPRQFVASVRESTGTNWTPYDSRRTFLTNGEPCAYQRPPGLTTEPTPINYRLLDAIHDASDILPGRRILAAP